MLTFIFAVSLALSMSFLCSLCEAVILSLSPAQVAELDLRDGKPGGIWSDFKANIQKPIAVILMINTAAHTIGASVAGAAFDDFASGGGILLFSIIFTFVMVQFTEILPKTMGVRYNYILAKRIGPVLFFMVRLLSPIITLIHKINRPFEGRKGGSTTPANIDEIAALAGLARISNQISSHQEHIINTASRLSRTRVHQVMIPVEQMVLFSTKASLTDAVIAAHIDAHTRFPICEDGNPHRVVGYVNFKEMIYSLRTNPKDPSLTGIMHPMHFVGPQSPVADLLKFFVDEHEHMAIVRGDDGKTLGLVTMEDIMEELLGELGDEFDQVPHYIHALSSGVWIVGGGSPISELATRLGRTFPDAKGAISTWLTQRIGRTPKAGDTVRVDGCEFLVRRTRRGKVFEATVNTNLPAAA
jgi:CBS domain containing-hemolysin-like protein